MFRQILLAVVLLASGGTLAQEDVSGVPSRTTFIGTTPLFLCGMLQVEAEQKLEGREGVFAQGRWWAPMEDGLFAGGQVAWRHHFRSLARGLFVGPYLDLNVFRFDATADDEEDYSARILVLGGQWGGRYTFDGRGYIGFRIGAGVPVMKEFDREFKTGNEFADTLSSIADRIWVRPALLSYSMIDASLSFGYAF